MPRDHVAERTRSATLKQRGVAQRHEFVSMSFNLALYSKSSEDTVGELTREKSAITELQSQRGL